MKKYLIALALGMVLVLALATVASADNGPHGGFTNTTEKCAGCHRAHSAQSSEGFLLTSSDVTALCMSCHKNGAGAYTDVANGVYFNGSVTGLAAPYGAQGDAARPLFGGGFEFTASAHTWNGKDGYDATAGWPSAAAATSTHSIKGLGASTGAGTVWGSNDINVAADVWDASSSAVTLECTSCHNPHGNAGRFQSATWTPGTPWTANVSGASPTTYGGLPTGHAMPSYRLLRFEPEGSSGFEALTGTTASWWALGNTQSTEGITVRETANYWYTINSDETLDPTVQFFRSRYDSTAGEWTEWSSYVAQKGDNAGRNYVYQRPAVSVTTSAAGNGAATSVFTCKDGSGNLPPLPTGTPGTATYTTYACGAVAGTTFNNSNTTLAGSGATNRSAGRAQLGFWCATCHDRYLAGSNNNIATLADRNSRTSDSGDSYYTFRHNSSNSVPCVDCHVAHGTSSVMTTTNTTYASASLTSGSILMKLDERSICLKCHSHDVNFQFAP